MTDLDPSDLADLEGRDERVPVIFAVHNDQFEDGRPIFIPRQFMATTTTLLEVQALLENGSLTDVGAGVRRATDIIASLIADRDLAEQIAASLAEGGVLR